MKKITLLFAVIAIAASSCSQYTCPTYAKAEKPVKKVELNQDQANKY